jgi:hypothetical protein
LLGFLQKDEQLKRNDFWGDCMFKDHLTHKKGNALTFHAFKHGLALSDLLSLKRILFEAIWILRRNKQVQPNNDSISKPEATVGPFITRAKSAMGDLLLFVPRSIESHLIDHATGGYGYSHVAIDCGEIDISTRQRVMVESTVKNPVWRVRQDRYGKRPYVRIPLAEVGLDVGSFCDCVKSRLGEPYDDLEALTWGAVDDPAKQICSDLAADCLPREVALGMAQAYQSGKLRRDSLSIHNQRDGQVGIFISPNGFGEYFGAPPGNRIHSPGQRILPRLVEGGLAEGHLIWFGWTVLAGAAAAGLIGWSLSRLVRGKAQS